MTQGDLSRFTEAAQLVKAVGRGVSGSEENRPDELIRGFIAAGDDKAREVMHYLAGIAAVCVLELADERGVSFDDVLDRICRASRRQLSDISGVMTSARHG